MDTTTGISPSSVEALALRILGGCRGVVYRQYPHLDAALAGLVPECAKETEIVGTDGLRLFFPGRKCLPTMPPVHRECTGGICIFAAWPVPACDWRKAV